MTASMSRRWVYRILCPAALAAGVISVSLAAQTDPFVGRWVALQREHGVFITLTIGASSTLIFPGLRQDGRSEALTLAVKNLRVTPQTATFTVDLPENEGALEFEFRLVGADGSGRLSVLRVDGQNADDDVPSWVLRKMP